MMRELSEGDFTPLDTFALHWRWTNSTHNVLPSGALAAMRPLIPERAHEVWERSLNHARELWESKPSGPALHAAPGPLFAEIADFDATEEAHRVSDWLAGLALDRDAAIIISWDSRLALATMWGVFCDYWADFCYPGSDDTTIMPIAEPWMLQWHHEGAFIFGYKRMK